VNDTSMTRLILICNAGSTSLKFKLFHMPSEAVVLSAQIERVGSDRAMFSLVKDETVITAGPLEIADYAAGVELFVDAVQRELGFALEPSAIGYKTVLAKDFFGVHIITEDVLEAMREWYDVAPAHNGPYLAAISTLTARWPDVPHVAVFETHFHRTIPEARALYGLPLEWAKDYGIRRYGYHGSSHRYVTETVRKQHEDASHIISCHLGGSGSISAVKDGESIDNSFGFSLQTGVMHGSRVGDVDAFVFPFLMRRGYSAEQIEEALTKNGGLKGLSGISGDLRDIEEQLDLDPRANLAFDVYVEHVLREIGRAYAVLGGLTDLIFTGGIGENSRLLRAEVITKLSHLGLKLDEAKNLEIEGEGRIDCSGPRIHVLPTNEELIVAREVFSCLFT
jgi:acetate kinase